MIVGTGIDMIEVSRVAEKIEKESGFRELVFSAAEINYCESCANKFEHYAARFAAKESFLKAAGKGLMLSFALSNIEVLHDELGKPVVVLHDAFKRLADENGWKRFHISLSHIRTLASAVVIIEQ